MSAETSRVFVKKVGSGPDTLLLFHGFGQDHSALLPVAEAVGDQYTCYLFDLYYHGQSHWGHDNTPIGKKDWTAYFNGFLKEHGISKFSVLGFSLGARLALACVEAFPDRTEALFLIAPDGLRASPWYTLATGTGVTRKLFRACITRPGIFFKLADTLRRWGLLDARLHRIAGYYMNNPEKREQVYHAWVAFRLLRAAPRHLAGLIRQHSIRAVIIVGQRDTLIPPARVQELVKHLKGSEYTLMVLPVAHHQLLGDALISTLCSGNAG
jgi:pimeloyl-ACP methyl ester carboxylesterase